MSLDSRYVEALPVDELLACRKRFARELRTAPGLRPLRLAVLGGSTTTELLNFLELFLLASGFEPVFYESEYGRYYEDAVVDSSRLAEFHPELVYLYTSHTNVQTFPSLPCTEEEHASAAALTLGFFQTIWRSLDKQFGCQVIQNNFDPPACSIFGNLDNVVPGGRTRFLLDLNAAFAAEARINSRLRILDLHSVAGHVGLDRWYAPHRYFSYKLLYSAEGSKALARSLSASIRALYGKSRKVLVLDLDNTLWGGVIGDDGVDRIQIGRETPVAEAYTAFHQYCLSLRERGVLLAVASKNDDEVARSGFTHPDSVLKPEHFSAFRANWQPKDENIRDIAKELNLGLDSFVFVDDNPAERHIVASQLPEVAVPDVGADVSQFPAMLDRERYFEVATLSEEDFERGSMYAQSTRREAQQSRFASYGDYLDSLEMEAEIDRFQPVYLERIAQLTNKTNQFNLTTQRCTPAEMEAYAADPETVPLYGRLRDRFGDSGLVSVVVGRRQGTDLHLNLWLMSCRVLKRDMEKAMLDSIAEHARNLGVSRLVGYYRPTKKNGMVADFYRDLGFSLQSNEDEATVWALNLDAYERRNTHIKVTASGYDRRINTREASTDLSRRV